MQHNSPPLHLEKKRKREKKRKKRRGKGEVNTLRIGQSDRCRPTVFYPSSSFLLDNLTVDKGNGKGKTTVPLYDRTSMRGASFEVKLRRNGEVVELGRMIAWWPLHLGFW